MSESYSDYIEKYYDILAREIGERYEYERWMKDILRRRDYEQTLKVLLHQICNRHFEEALEIGCGVGTWTVHLSRLCDNLTILDVSENMVEVTINRLHRRNFCNVQGIVGDFQDPHLRVEGSYDAIFCVRAVEYMENKAYALSRIRGLLRNGGIALIMTKNPNKGIIPFAFLLTRRLFKPPKLFSNLIHYRDLLVIAQNAGFKNIHAYPVITSFYCPLLDNNAKKLMSDRVHELLYKKHMNPLYLPFIESYAIAMRR